MCADKLGEDNREWLLIWLSGQGSQSSTAEKENPTTADITYRSLLHLVNVPIIFQVSG